MTVNVTADEIYLYFTRDCDRDYLGYEGVLAVVKYFEDFEEEMGEPLQFDISCLWDWHKATSWLELAQEFDKDIAECTEEEARQYFYERGACLDCDGFVLFSESH